MIFRRKPQPELTNDAYRRWLRAHRPPFAMFLSMSEIEQEQLALLGDMHTQDVVIAIGYAVKDPTLAEAGLEARAGKSSGDETLVRHLLDGFSAAVAGRSRRPGAQVVRAPVRAPAFASESAPQADTGPGARTSDAPTLAGFGTRQRAEEAAKKIRTLFGRAADKAAT